jgi:hypothetical protein
MQTVETSIRTTLDRWLMTEGDATPSRTCEIRRHSMTKQTIRLPAICLGDRDPPRTDPEAIHETRPPHRLHPGGGADGDFFRRCAHDCTTRRRGCAQQKSCRVIPSREIFHREVAEPLGPVDIHFSQIMAATRNSTAANDTTVFS